MSQSYTTQMDAARKGIFTPQMEQVLANEPISKEHNCIIGVRVKLSIGGNSGDIYDKFC